MRESTQPLLIGITWVIETSPTFPTKATGQRPAKSTIIQLHHVVTWKAAPGVTGSKLDMDTPNLLPRRWRMGSGTDGYNRG